MSTEASVERIANEVLTRLDKIGEWLQGSGTEVLDIYAQQIAWSSGGFFLGGAGFIFLACIPGYYCYWQWKNDREEGHFIPLGILAVALSCWGGVIAFGGVLRLAVPEYYAIQELVQQVL